MDYVSIFQKHECLEYLLCVAADRVNREALVIVFLDVLVKVAVQQLENNKLVIPPFQKLDHTHDIVTVGRVF